MAGEASQPDSGTCDATAPSDGSRPQTYFVDWSDLESKLSARAMQTTHVTNHTDRRRSGPRLITTVDRETDHLRENVKDAAKAVLSWLSAVANHDGSTDLNAVLDRCLRPGPDVGKLNYEALAKEVSETIGVELSAKRVRTAVEHLRKSHEQKANTMQRQSIKQKLDALHAQLQDNYSALLDADGTAEGDSLRRLISVDVLAAVRCAAGRMIENDFGEGIPQSVDVDQLQDRFLDFVRDVMGGGRGDEQNTLAADLHRLLVTLCDYDRSSESDMQVVVDGSRVVADLAGPGSLAGLIGQLNVLVTGRFLLDTQTYCGELARLAEAAAALNEDGATRTFMNWVHRQQEDRRVPSPLRISSYCLNNAATHMLERIFKGELSEDVNAQLKTAEDYIEQMRRRDSGFVLIKTTEVIYLTVVAKLTGDASPIESLFQSLGRAQTLSRLEDLANYESCRELVQAAQAHAISAIPQLKHQLIRVD